INKAEKTTMIDRMSMKNKYLDMRRKEAKNEVQSSQLPDTIPVRNRDRNKLSKEIEENLGIRLGREQKFVKYKIERNELIQQIVKRYFTEKVESCKAASDPFK
ncbi:hypothetical protein PFISCL1PPCAC_851, partial [Pristionchus fissidentatus]